MVHKASSAFCPPFTVMDFKKVFLVVTFSYLPQAASRMEQIVLMDLEPAELFSTPGFFNTT
jgi:hypothetical protein